MTHRNAAASKQRGDILLCLMRAVHLHQVSLPDLLEPQCGIAAHGALHGPLQFAGEVDHARAALRSEHGPAAEKEVCPTLAA